jgi:hypothetical protein
MAIRGNISSKNIHDTLPLDEIYGGTCIEDRGFEGEASD